MKKIKERYLFALVWVLVIPSSGQFFHWLSLALPFFLALSYFILRNKSSEIKSSADLMPFLSAMVFAFWVMCGAVYGIEEFYPFKKSIEIFLASSLLILMPIVADEKSFENFLWPLKRLCFLIALIVIFAHFSKAALGDFYLAKNQVSFFLYIGVSVTLIDLFVKNGGKYNWFIAVIMFFAISLSYSTKYLIFAGITFAIFFAWKGLSWIKSFRIRSLLSALFFLFIGLQFLLYLLLNHVGADWQLTVAFEKARSVFTGSSQNAIAQAHLDYRYSLVRSGLDIWWDNFIFGIGLENTRLMLSSYSHNNWVEIAAGTGFVGVVLWFSISFSFIIFLTSKRFFHPLVLIFVLVLILPTLGHRVYDNQLYYLLLIVLFGFLRLHSGNGKVLFMRSRRGGFEEEKTALAHRHRKTPRVPRTVVFRRVRGQKN